MIITELAEASESGDIVRLNTLLEDEEALSLVATNNNNLFRIAATNGQIDILVRLLEFTAVANNILSNEPGREGETNEALEMAVSYGHLSIARILLEYEEVRNMVQKRDIISHNFILRLLVNIHHIPLIYIYLSIIDNQERYQLSTSNWLTCFFILQDPELQQKIHIETHVCAIDRYLQLDFFEHEDFAKIIWLLFYIDNPKKNKSKIYGILPLELISLLYDFLFYSTSETTFEEKRDTSLLYLYGVTSPADAWLARKLKSLSESRSTNAVTQESDQTLIADSSISIRL